MAYPQKPTTQQEPQWGQQQPQYGQQSQYGQQPQYDQQPQYGQQPQQYGQQQRPPQQQQAGWGVPVMAAVITPAMPPPQLGFSQPLCNCTDDTNVCLEEMFCCYCHLGFVYQWLEDRRQDMSPLACCGTLLIDLVLLAGFGRCAMVSHVRQRLATLYNIQEDPCNNIMTSFCCSSCAMCQLHREMVVRGCFTGGICYNPPVQLPYPAAPSMIQQQQPGRRW